ncbi:TPA: hypothetical protein ENS27_14715 [bacterium]|mgnify:CR=1 FL=1|nr:hypothetical protein [bacterium]
MFYFKLIFYFVILLCSALMVIADEGSYQEYIINYGDQLIINFVGREGVFPETVIVRPDGMITYAYVGELKAVGLTISQLSDNITKRLLESRRYTDPKITIQLKEAKQFNIYVIGEVIEPGQKSFVNRPNVIEALAWAGGFKENADLANAFIIGRKKNLKPINLEFLRFDPAYQKSIIQGFSDEIYVLNDGDILSIPSSIKESQIKIIGHVHKPGVYPVKTNISIIEALAIAGGALENTADLKKIMILSKNGAIIVNAFLENNLQTQNLANNSAYERIIEPGDSVIVPERGKISIIGFVEKQGQYDVSDSISIIEALSLSGVKEGADLRNVKIVKSDGKEITINLSKIWKKPESFYKEMIDSGDIIIVPSRRLAINWNAVYSAVMVFSTLYAVFK